MSNTKEQITEIVHNYAKILNSGEIGNLSSFYSQEALFMPDGQKALSKNMIGTKVNLLKNANFKIYYSAIEVTAEDNYAFVNATATVSEKDQNSDSNIEKTSRDFFVFKKEENEWKIFRYIFNNVKS